MIDTPVENAPKRLLKPIESPQSTVVTTSDKTRTSWALGIADALRLAASLQVESVESMDGKRAILALRDISDRGTSSRVQSVADDMPIFIILVMPVVQSERAAQGTVIPLHTIHASSVVQNPSDIDRLKDCALRWVRCEAGVQTAFRF